MTKTQNNLLFISPPEHINEQVIDLMRSNGFKVNIVSEVDDALKCLQNTKYQLTLSTEFIDEAKGDLIFQTLEPELLSQAIPFFLILEDCKKEDIMLALELGIDNIIFLPLDQEATIRKVNKEIAKKKYFNFLNTSDFKFYFNNSHIPMLLVDNDHIQEVNNSFSCIHQKNGLKGKRIDEVFEFPDSSLEKLNYKRFDSKISNYCKIKNISFKEAREISFNILMFKGTYFNHKTYLIELSPNPESGMEISYNSKREELGNYRNPILTPREHQVLELSSEGLPIKLIADRLSVSNRTIEKHRSNIMEKLGVRNIIEAVSTVNTLRGGNNHIEAL
ncbi:response regulator transcription factor [Cyclobacterium plantarum]|uniref:Helix-turn-helix transcriptional regulator n=1 Tax=Cyclobacterium plantarum TaxID=2716263 RepID=A0ABX0HAY6_9BACT|nr:helix-turn-helix transcriptional regulator [Cyclobacterium plantarum]NHE58854.1 helix-turn-helix transcriptional regulator [Cyclobacterium plantarum]